jgi:spore coat polysaccharide biosynthesis protein SpsF (cytidylyltransferase family)
MKTVAIIQADVRSNRLPGKLLASIVEQPLLGHVIDRVRQARLIDQTAIATSTHPADDVIAEFCRQKRICCVRGSETDLLDRYHQAADSLEADAVVRIRSDCPLIDPAIIDAVIAPFHNGAIDYASNVVPSTFPAGLDTEIFSVRALDSAWTAARIPSEREQVTPFLRNHPEMFPALNVRHHEDLSALRWTVETLEDLAFVRAVFHALGKACFTLDDVCRLLTDSPRLHLINGGTARNEGSLRSPEMCLHHHALVQRQVA